MPTIGRRRALGQHFLKDQAIARVIAKTAVEEAVRAKCQSLLEIGPGKGAITLPLLELLADSQSAPKKIILCERDRALATDWLTHGKLRVPMGAGLSFSVEEGDFLDLPEERWLTTPPIAVASNLPYSAGTAIFTRLAHHADHIPVMVLMFQAEVAQRLRAEPNTKSWGSLSVWTQNHWDVRRLVAVPPGAFAPPPDVQSEVVIITRRETPRIDTSGNELLWESLLRACFAHRRKMLRSGLPSGQYRKALEQSEIDGTKRAEALNWEEWERLFKSVLQTKE